MLTSFVVRVTPAALAAGVFAGEVEHVQTGERADFRDADELCAWCARLLPPLPPGLLPAPRPVPAETHVLQSPSVDPGDLS